MPQEGGGGAEGNEGEESGGGSVDWQTLLLMLFAVDVMWFVHRLARSVMTSQMILNGVDVFVDAEKNGETLFDYNIIVFLNIARQLYEYSFLFFKEEPPVRTSIVVRAFRRLRHFNSRVSSCIKFCKLFSRKILFEFTFGFLFINCS